MFIISDAKIEFLNNKILIICFLKVKAKATPRRITLWHWKKLEAPNTTEGLAPERMEEPQSYTTWFILHNLVHIFSRQKNVLCICIMQASKKFSKTFS